MVCRVELTEVLRGRHMVRSFSGRPVPDEVLAKIVAAAAAAPSAGNADGWEAVVVVGPEQTARFWEATTTADWRATSRRWPGLSRAPVVVAIFVNPDAYVARYAEPDKAASGLGTGLDAWPIPYWFVDGGFTVLLMLLAAVDAGLGACFLGNFRGESELRSALDVGDEWRYLGAVLFGEGDGLDTPSVSARRGRRDPASAVRRAKLLSSSPPSSPSSPSSRSSLPSSSPASSSEDSTRADLWS